MTSERWQRIETLFHAALEREAQERAAFLGQACDGDPELHSQVRALLASFDAAGDFIEQPLVERALTSLPEQNPPSGSIIGHKIGNYEILSLLGTGGMGEVYLARDARLDRQIALKLLPAQFTQDPDQVRRFEREARAASALNHPNIITIHDIGQEGGTHFIAMEFIAGRTLREIIARQKVDLVKALNIAVQIASALAAAHAAGIVHRDVKPENVMVRPDGLVKVLDFGLAKPAAPNLVEVTTGRLRRLEMVSLQTDPKMLMGTLAYLSPEQGRGEPVDYRTDIFSLGVVLYEMVSGARPFDGQNATAILDAIQHQPPAPMEINNPAFSSSQRPLNAIISTALAKDRAARYGSAAEMQADLRTLAHALEAPAANLLGKIGQPPPSPVWWSGIKGKAALAAGALAFLAGLWSLRTQTGSGPNAPSLGVKEARRLTDQAGYKLFPSLSPDGRSVVYASRIGTNWDIYLQ
jgi:serine/threonine protein kinase